MSGEIGMSISNWNNIHYLNNFEFDPNTSEVAVLDSVNLTDALLCVFATQHC